MTLARRRGRSLIELMVVMAVVSMLLTSIAQIMITLMRADGNGRDAVAARANLHRLTNQFRDDVHAAESAELIAGEDNEPAGLKLFLSPDRHISYVPLEQGLTRTLFDSDRRTAHEQYRLWPGDCEFSVPSGDSRTVAIVLTHGVPGEPRVDVSEVLGPPLRLEFTLSRDQRYVTAGETN